MSDVVQHLRDLMVQRAEHVTAIRDIDMRLAEARRVLGMIAPALETRVETKIERTRRPKRSMAEKCEYVMKALGEREPRRADEFGDHYANIQPALRLLMIDGRIVRRRLEPTRPYHGLPAYAYARSLEAFGSSAADEEAAEALDAEAG